MLESKENKNNAEELHAVNIISFISLHWNSYAKDSSIIHYAFEWFYTMVLVCRHGCVIIMCYKQVWTADYVKTLFVLGKGYIQPSKTTVCS